MKDKWLYIITPFFLIVPILTYEGIIGWMIGLIGIYKCYTYEKIYRSIINMLVSRYHALFSSY